MTNDKVRILDHTTAVFGTELTADWCGEQVPKEVTIDGILFIISDPMVGYANEEQGLSLYMEGSDLDWTDIWYAQTDPLEK